MEAHILETINPPVQELSGPFFSLPVPKEWRDRSIYVAGGPIKEGFQSSITVTFEYQPELKSLAENFETQLNLLKGQLEEFQLLEKEQRSIAMRPTFWVSYTWTTPELVPLRQSQWYFHVPPNVVVITATAHQKAFEELEVTFEGIVKGYLSKKPKL